MQQLIIEVDILQKLKNQHIVPYYGCSLKTDQNLLYIFLAYFPLVSHTCLYYIHVYIVISNGCNSVFNKLRIN